MVSHPFAVDLRVGHPPGIAWNGEQGKTARLRFVVSHPSPEKSEEWGTRTFAVDLRVGHPPVSMRETHMAFMICFTDEPDEYPGDDPTIPAAVGRIVAGKLDENFLSNLYEWNKRAYQSQWLRSLERFLDGEEKAVLITWYVNRRESSNLEWWALYRGKAGIVHVQNHLPWYDNLGPLFSVEQASSFLQDRITVNEDGDSLSEWDVPFEDVEHFVGQLKRQIAEAP